MKRLFSISRTGRHKTLLAALLAAVATSAGAQYTHWEVGVNGSYATPNNFNMMEFATGAVSIDVAWMRRSVGDEYWQLHRRYPTFGIRGSLAYVHQSVYGHRFGLVGLVRAPINSWLDYSMGLGVAVFTRPQYLTGDTVNIFISKPLSCLIDVGLNARLGDRYLLNASILHSSNGMLLRPNKGVNFLQLGMAVKIGNEYERSLSWRDARLRAGNGEPFERTEVGLALSLGSVMSRDTAVDGYFACYDLSLNYQHYLNPHFSVGGTLDFWYNWVDKDPVADQMAIHTFPVYVSALAGCESFFGPLSIKAGLGFSLIVSSQVTIPVYERVGAYYNFPGRRHYLGMALNAHAGRIEFIEWTYGFRLR